MKFIVISIDIEKREFFEPFYIKYKYGYNLCKNHNIEKFYIYPAERFFH